MSLSTGDRLTYIATGEAWYAESLTDEDRATIIISTDSDSAEHGDWEFTIGQAPKLANPPALRMEMYDDSFRAFTEAPELFTALAAERPTALEALRGLLDKLGALDITPRVREEQNR